MDFWKNGPERLPVSGLSDADVFFLHAKRLAAKDCKFETDLQVKRAGRNRYGCEMPTARAMASVEVAP